ncbi:hypothetical protein NKI51_29535 [Mesorhizobium australicum]|uniref:hypothetical protein n=1 Tax=Mesorhizobium australicum TaxID=536018 RepID=UPI003337924E
MKPWSRPSWKRWSLAATLAAAERLENDRGTQAMAARVEQAKFAVERAERRYRAVDPDNRLVARTLEQHWEEALRALEAAKAELVRREAERSRGHGHGAGEAASPRRRSGERLARADHDGA